MRAWAVAMLASSLSSTVLSLTAQAAIVEDKFTGYVSSIYGDTSQAFVDLQVGATYSATFKYNTSLGSLFESPVSQNIEGGPATSTTSPVISANITIGNVTFDVNGTQYGRVQNDNNGVTSAVGRQSFDGGNTYFDEDIQPGNTSIPVALDTNISLSSLPQPNQFGTLSLDNGRIALDTQTFTQTAMSSVPLPAAAPLLGAALVALGAVGCGLKRKRAVAA